MSKQSPHPSWATQYRTKGTELRFLNGRYYLYAVSSKYDPILTHIAHNARNGRSKKIFS